MQKKLKGIKPGEIFKFGGYEWIKLEDGFAITKDTVTDKEFNASCNNDFMTSDIMSYLTETFAKEIWDNGGIYSEFDYFPLNLTADDGMKKYEPRNVQLGLLTADLYRKNRHLIEPISGSWWLATPKSYISDYIDTVLFVDSDGIIWDEYAEDMRGVRPLCKLSDDTLVEVLDEDKPTEVTKDVTELIKKWGEENNLTHRTYDQHIYRLIRKIGGLTKHIEENDYNEAKQDLGYIYAALVILAKKLSGTGNEDYTSFLIDEIEAGHNIW